MGRGFILPETYDRKILDQVDGIPVKFVTQSGRVICADCANGNRNKVIDANSPDWLIVGITSEESTCNEHEEDGNV